MNNVEPQGVQSAANWTAHFSNHHLKVEGEITFPTPGYKAHLRKKEPQGISPETLLLEKVVKMPTGIEPDHVVTERVRFEERTHTRYQQVEIFPDGIRVNVTQD